MNVENSPSEPADEQPHEDVTSPSTAEHQGSATAATADAVNVDTAVTAPEDSEASGPDDQDPAAAKRRRPETLVELYTRPQVQATELLAALAKRDAWTTSSDDQDHALALLPERDPLLRRTRTLAHHVATGHDGRFAASFESFLVRAVEPQLGGTPAWPPSEGTIGPVAFRQILEHHVEALLADEPPKPLFNALMIAQAVLMARYRLDIPDVVPALSRVLGPPAALRGERRNPRLTRLRALGDPRLTIEMLRSWLDVLSPWIERAVKAERETKVARLEHERAEATVRAHAARIQDLERLLEEARSEIVGLRQEVQARTDRERGVTLARQHEGSQLRGSMAGFLADDVMGLLASVREGLELQPPRASYSLERLEDLEHAIEGKVRWLRSSA